MQKININNFEECIYHKILSNKLDVYLLPMKNKKDFFALLGTKYGGENINFKVDNKTYKMPSGIAHFLEHKMFDNNATAKPFEFYSKTGTDVNAYTTNEYTAYHFFGNKDFYNNLRFLLNWLKNFSINDEQIVKEQGIILEESRMYEDNPDRKLYELLKENTLINHPLRLKTIGSNEDIKRINSEELNICHRSFYRPDNMFLIIVGCFDEQKTINLIEETLDDFKSPDEKITKLYEKEPDNVNKEFEKIAMNVKIPKVGYTIKINKNDYKKIKIPTYSIDYYLYMILNIAFGSTSDFKEYLLKNKIMNSMSYQITDIKSHYLIEFYFTSELPDLLIKEIDKYLKKIAFSKTSFERIKKTWIASEIRMIDNINVTANNIIDDILDYGEYKNNKIKDIKELSYDHLLKVYKNTNMSNKSKIIITNNGSIKNK